MIRATCVSSIGGVGGVSVELSRLGLATDPAARGWGCQYQQPDDAGKVAEQRAPAVDDRALKARLKVPYDELRELVATGGWGMAPGQII